MKKILISICATSLLITSFYVITFLDKIVKGELSINNDQGGSLFLIYCIGVGTSAIFAGIIDLKQ